jgi:hypothetical protein
MLHLSRRKFLTGLFAAPAVIAINRLMPVKALEPYVVHIESSDLGFRLHAHIVDESGRDVFLTRYLPATAWDAETEHQLFTMPARSWLKSITVQSAFDTKTSLSIASG